jgi:hypothetical protein
VVTALAGYTRDSQAMALRVYRGWRRLHSTHERDARGTAPLGGLLPEVELRPALDIARMAELVETYLDLSPGIVDAGVAVIAERLGLTEIATLDHRHFTVIRLFGISSRGVDGHA